MKIRQTTFSDMPDLLETFDYGRKLQRALGNYYQWRNGEPNQSVLEQDIRDGTSYVCVIDEHSNCDLPIGTIVATFYLLKGENAIFKTLKDGTWLNPSPYVTIHRMCTNGKIKGASQFCMKWIIERYDNIRIYTHDTNKQMIHVIEKYGFSYCGNIYPPDGEPRNAYQYAADNQIKEVM